MIQELHYEVNEYRTFSKIDAFRAANGDAAQVKLNFMRSTFGHRPFTRPESTWTQLLRTRCQQLRDSYDWLALWFSGGWDSTTVLDAFVDNGIVLDEIVIYDRKWFEDSEIISALAYAQQVKKNHFPNLYINYVGIDHSHFNSIYESLGADWIFTPGCSVTYPKMHRYFLHNWVDSTARVVGKHTRRGDLYAHDKPRVLFADGMWYNFMGDAGMYQYMNVDCEFFYITGQLPELHIEQCHLAIDHFEKMIAEMGRPGFQHLHAIQGNRCLDWQYESWSMALGRTCTDDPSARQGWQKGRVGQTPFTEEGVTALKLIDLDRPSLKIYRTGLHDIAAITNISIPKDAEGDWLPSVLSDWYPIRPLASNLLHLWEDK